MIKATTLRSLKPTKSPLASFSLRATPGKVLGPMLLQNTFYPQMARTFSASAAKVKTADVADTFKASDLSIEKVDIRKIKPKLKSEYVFGKLFTDHMLSIDWTKAGGWAKPQIIPYGPIKLETSATALHYGISVHEGLSVVQNTNTGKMQGFRVHEHLQGLYDSSEHLDMPVFDKGELLDCIKELVILDKEWMYANDEPDQFYTRMVHFATDKTLGVRTPHATRLLAMINPVMLNAKPITLKCSTNVNKNWPLGHG